MQRLDNWIYCWPGLRAAWREGQTLGVLWAVAFSILLNLAIVSTLVWSQWLGMQVPQGLWLAVVAVWLGSAWHEFRWQKRSQGESPRESETDDALFIQAQAEYLKGNWEEAEWLLRQRLSTCHRDVESRLLLVTLYRRQGQRQSASEQLQILRRFDGSREWAEEINGEARLIDSADNAKSDLGDEVKSAGARVDSTAELDFRKMNTNAVRRAA